MQKEGRKEWRQQEATTTIFNTFDNKISCNIFEPTKEHNEDMAKMRTEEHAKEAGSTISIPMAVGVVVVVVVFMHL